MICRNARDLLTGGKRYPDVEWDRAGRVNAPITHTAGDGERIRIEVSLTAAGFPDNTPYLLLGASSEPALCFRREGVLSPGRKIVLELEAAHPLGGQVRRIQEKVYWRLHLRVADRAVAPVVLGDSGPHVIYSTLGRPRDADQPLHAVTDARMELAVRRVAAAQAQAGTGASPPRIIHELMKQEGRLYFPARHCGGGAWKVPETWEMSPPGASCISIVEFAVLLCKMIGVEGNVVMSAYCARPPQPLRAVRGGLGDPPIFRRGPLGETSQLFLVDESNTNRGQAGGVGGMNYYEAVLEYKWQGVTYYFPGGTDRVYDSPDPVLLTFRTLAWARWDPLLQEWVVAEVVHTYIRGDAKRPPSIRLP